MNTKKVLYSVAAAIATSRLAKSLSSLDADDVLGTVGLARRRSYALTNFALVAGGAALGATAALLLAPSSGADTRAKLGRKVGDIGHAAGEAARAVQRELPSIDSMRQAIHNGMAGETQSG